MSNVQHHKLKVSRTAQVFTYGNKESARIAVLILQIGLSRNLIIY